MNMKTILLCITGLLINNYFSQVEGALDLSFNPNAGPNGPVEAIAVQNDGKILIGGGFSTYDNVPSASVARLNPNGTIDATFDIGDGILWGATVSTIATLPDGKIYLGGTFTNFNNNYSNKLVRLLANGNYDATFEANTAINGSVHVLIVQNDGKVLVGGNFTVGGANPRKNILRLNTDGTLDNTFVVGTGANSGTSASLVNDMKLQSDGRIIIVGSFLNYNGTERKGIARLNTDGTLDTSFDPGLGANNEVRSVSIQNDGKMIISGGFNSYNGSNITKIARINSDGSLDNTFVPNINTTANLFIGKNVIENSGKILISGNGTFERLNSDGSADLTYNNGNTGPNNVVGPIQIQPDGKAIIAGNFTTYNGETRNRIARLNGLGTAGITSNVLNEITIYPNPSNGIIYFDNINYETLKVKIIDFKGNIVFEESKYSSSSLDLSHLKQGVYVIDLENKSNIFKKKVVMQ
jgi:uncharacterized delta-60 repeat protein